MKLTGCLLLLTLLTSCGKNAFLEKNSNNEIIRRGVQGDDTPPGSDDECVVKTLKLDPQNRAYNYNEHPFLFSRIRLGDHTNHIQDGSGNSIEYVDYAQVVLDYDLSIINEIDAKIVKISLDFSSDQYFKTDGSYGHKSQICHNQNYTCSGVESSVDGHINNASYTWINEEFTNYVDNFDIVSTHCEYSLRQVVGEYDLTSFFTAKSDVNTQDLRSDYTVFIADNHKVKKAQLNISYCEKQ